MTLLRAEVLWMYKEKYRVVLWLADEHNVQITQDFFGTLEECKQWLMMHL